MSVDNLDVTIAQLAIAMNILPSQLKKEDIHDITNLLAVLRSQYNKSEKQIKKINKKYG